jgi:hypothetical protein
VGILNIEKKNIIDELLLTYVNIDLPDVGCCEGADGAAVCI